jgi:hypothetical protein
MRLWNVLRDIGGGLLSGGWLDVVEVSGRNAHHNDHADVLS